MKKKTDETIEVLGRIYDYTLEEILDAMKHGGRVYIDEDPTEVNSFTKVRSNDMRIVKSNKEVKASNTLSAQDQALTHIKAAIDILGKSGKKDDITKDSIANLATVMFDIKASKES